MAIFQQMQCGSILIYFKKFSTGSVYTVHHNVSTLVDERKPARKIRLYKYEHRQECFKRRVLAYIFTGMERIKIFISAI